MSWLNWASMNLFCLILWLPLYAQLSYFSYWQTYKDFRYPICAGGGIQSVSDATNLIQAGADRISINTYALENHSIIGSLTKALGISCVVSQIDVRKIDKEFRLFTHAGRELSQYTLKSWLNFLSENNVGEIIVTSIDRDGTCRSIDWDLVNFMERKPFALRLLRRFSRYDRIKNSKRIKKYEWYRRNETFY